jgi:hypothetical protein
MISQNRMSFSFHCHHIPAAPAALFKRQLGHGASFEGMPGIGARI